MSSKKTNKGFTLVELLVAVSILLVLGGITIGVFYNKLRSASVNQAADTSLSLIEKARNQTLNSLNGSSFGIKVSTSTMSVFEGTSYNPANVEYFFDYPGNVNVRYSLSGGVSELYFARITGSPSATGTVTFLSKSNASTTKTLIISSTGLIEIQ